MHIFIPLFYRVILQLGLYSIQAVQNLFLNNIGIFQSLDIYTEKAENYPSSLQTANHRNTSTALK